MIPILFRPAKLIIFSLICKYFWGKFKKYRSCSIACFVSYWISTAYYAFVILHIFYITSTTVLFNLYKSSTQPLQIYCPTSLPFYPYLSPPLSTVDCQQHGISLFNSLENWRVYDDLSPTLPRANLAIL